jgi:hypothetical protein
VKTSLYYVPVLLVTKESLNLLMDFRTYSNIKFHENPFCESEVVPCVRTDGDITKLLVAFRSFANSFVIHLRPYSKKFNDDATNTRTQILLT